MNNIDLAMNIASTINFLALIPLLRTIIKNRNTLRGYSPTGSFLTFIAICSFQIAYLLMNNIISFTLGLTTAIFWCVAFIYSLKQTMQTKTTTETEKQQTNKP